MDNTKLQISLEVNSLGQLVVLDNTDSFDSAQHRSIEFLVYNEDSNICEGTQVVKNYSDSAQTFINLPKDGKYVYYKFAVPTLKHFENNPEALVGQFFWHNDKVYEAKEGFTGLVDGVLPKDLCEEISYYTLTKDEYLGENVANQTFSYDQVIFTIHNLNKCLVKYQKEVIFSSSFRCNTFDETRYWRDMLLSAACVINYLVDKDRENYIEAQLTLDKVYSKPQSILNSLTSCTTLCSQQPSNNCNCGTNI